MATASPKVKRTRIAKATPTAKPAPRKRTPKVTPQPVVVVRRNARSQAEWDKLALDTIVPALQGGTTMTAIRAQYGAGPTIRRALDRVGYNTKGQKVTKVQTKGSNQKVLAERINERRLAGAAFWRLEHETGMGADELKALLAKHGYGDTAAGRVILAERTKRRIAKLAA